MREKITNIFEGLDYLDRTRNCQFGVLTRQTCQGKAYAFLEDATKFTEGQALDEAMSFDTNDLLGLFSIDMATGDIKPVMNRAELVDCCEARTRSEMSDGEKEDQRTIDRHNFVHGTTL
jgi:hypothetical protein